MTALRLAAMALALATLAGCTAVRSTDRAIDHAHSQSLQNRELLDAFRDQARNADRARGQVVDLPWVAGRPQPLARQVTLPPALRANVSTTMLFEGSSADLGTLAERIQLATGILTQVAPDALLPREWFLPRLAIEQTAMAIASPTTADTLVPALIPELSVDRMAGPALPKGVARTKMEPLPAGSSPLSTVLDAISLRLGVYWRYDEKYGAIQFYRTETRTFQVKALELTAETSLELGLAGQGSGGQFTSQNRSKYTNGAQMRPAEAVLIKVSQYLTRAGVVKAAHGSANSIVVTDTKEALDAVERFLEAENRIRRAA